MLVCIALTAYPTFLRNFGGIGLGIVNLAQIAYALFLVQRAREAFTRRIRPPLVIKALLDMKGETLGATKAQPLTLGMLERLEGIVKVKDQQKFNVRSGREYLIAGVFILLLFSFAQVPTRRLSAPLPACQFMFPPLPNLPVRPRILCAAVGVGDYEDPDLPEPLLLARANRCH